MISASCHLSPRSYVSVCHRTTQRKGTERTHTATVNSTGFDLQDEHSGARSLTTTAGFGGGGLGVKAGGEGNSNPVSARDERSPSLKGTCLCCCPGSRVTTVTSGLLLMRYKVLRSRGWQRAHRGAVGENALSPSPPAARPRRAGSSPPPAAGRLGAQKASGEALRPFSVRGILTRGAPPAPFAGKRVCDAPAAKKVRGTGS